MILNSGALFVLSFWSATRNSAELAVKRAFEAKPMFIT